MATVAERLHFVEVDRRVRATRSLGALIAAADRPVVLHTHHTAFDIPAALVARGRPDVAVLWHVHTALNPQVRIRLQNVAKFRLFSAPVARIVCVSSHLAEEIVRRGAPRAKVVVYPNSIDGRRFPVVSDPEREQARRELGLPPDAEVLLHFSWDWWIKGGDLLLRAVKQLVPSRAGRLVAVTVGDTEAAYATSRELGLGDHVRALEARPDVRPLFAAADVFVASSRAEGSPAAVLEALASGVPVVATRIPGHVPPPADIPAFRLADLDAASIAREVAYVLDGIGAMRSAARAARDQLHRLLDIDAWADGMCDLYADALHARD
jgi:glycosyltransferase involved in cell wall biosynthesis